MITNTDRTVAMFKYLDARIIHGGGIGMRAPEYLRKKFRANDEEAGAVARAWVHTYTARLTPEERVKAALRRTA